MVLRLHTNPRKIFGLAEQPDTAVEVDLDRKWVLGSKMPHTKCDWCPFEGIEVMGAISRVVLRGELVYLDGAVFAGPGNGQEQASDGSFWQAEQGSGGTRKAALPPAIRTSATRFSEPSSGLDRPRPASMDVRQMSPQRGVVGALAEVEPSSPKAPAYSDHVAAHPQHRAAVPGKSPMQALSLPVCVSVCLCPCICVSVYMCICASVFVPICLCARVCACDANSDVPAATGKSPMLGPAAAAGHLHESMVSSPRAAS